GERAPAVPSRLEGAAPVSLRRERAAPGPLWRERTRAGPVRGERAAAGPVRGERARAGCSGGGAAVWLRPRRLSRGPPSPGYWRAHQAPSLRGTVAPALARRYRLPAGRSQDPARLGPFRPPHPRPPD